MRRRSPIFLLGLAAATIATAGIAFAAWNATGTGEGYAKATSADVLTTVDVSATAAADLYPGFADGDLIISISNPNPYPVRVTQVNGSGVITSDAGTACNAATGVSYTSQTGLGLDVAAGSEATFTLADSVAMSNASDNSCQGATFTVPVTLVGNSNA